MTGKTKRVSLFLRTGRSVRIKVPTVRWMLFLSVPSNHWVNSSNQREKRKIKAPLPKGTNGWVKYNPQVRFNLLGVSDETLWSLKWLENHQKRYQTHIKTLFCDCLDFPVVQCPQGTKKINAIWLKPTVISLRVLNISNSLNFAMTRWRFHLMKTVFVHFVQSVLHRCFLFCFFSEKKKNSLAWWKSKVWWSCRLVL